MQVWAQLLAEHHIEIAQAYFFRHGGRRFEHQFTPTEGTTDVISSLSVPYCLATAGGITSSVYC